MKTRRAEETTGTALYLTTFSSYFFAVSLEMAPVELNKNQFASRVKKVYEGWNVCHLLQCRKNCRLGLLTDIHQSASQNEDFSSIADVDALFLLAGDPAAEDEPVRKGTCFQVSAFLPAANRSSILTIHGH